jgi:murein DD-endopeptidase MepM/ murein hydrolase activator NlpD
MKIMQALLWLLLIAIGSQDVIAANRYRSVSKQLRTRRKTHSKKNIATKFRIAPKSSGEDKNSALKYLPKLRNYVKSVNISPKKRLIRKDQRRRKSSRHNFLSKKLHRVKRTHLLTQNQEAEKIFSWPVDPKNFWMSSPFGPRTIRGKEGFHGGIDLAAPTGTDVYAAAAGKVIESRYSSGYGNFIVIAHDNGYKTRYAHLSRSHARIGHLVQEGDLIGKVGATGRIVKRTSSSSGAHLHFEVYRNGAWVDPIAYMR